MKLPEWFSLDNYSKASELDAVGWQFQIGCRMLLQYYKYHIDIGGFYTEDDERKFDTLYAQIAKTGLIANTEELNLDRTSYGNSALGKEIFYLEPFPYHVANTRWGKPLMPLSNYDVYQMVEYWVSAEATPRVEKFSESVTDSESKSGIWLDSPFAPNTTHDFLLGIDLGNSDQLLLGEFKQFLAQARNQRPNEKMNITSSTFLVWTRWKILPYWDLLFWSKQNNQHITNAQMLYILFPDEIVEADRIRKTVKPNMEHAFRVYIALRKMAKSQLRNMAK